MSVYIGWKDGDTFLKWLNHFACVIYSSNGCSENAKQIPRHQDARTRAVHWHALLYERCPHATEGHVLGCRDKIHEGCGRDAHRSLQNDEAYAHVSDNASRPADGQDRLYKIRPLVGALREKVRGIIPAEKLSIDELVVAFKGKSVLELTIGRNQGTQ